MEQKAIKTKTGVLVNQNQELIVINVPTTVEELEQAQSNSEGSTQQNS